MFGCRLETLEQFGSYLNCPYGRRGCVAPPSTSPEPLGPGRPTRWGRRPCVGGDDRATWPTTPENSGHKEQLQGELERRKNGK